MRDLKGTKTVENLKHAFCGEAMVNRRYLYFARRADEEGYPEIAALMRSIAEGETAHAFGHLDFIRQGGIEDPATNKPIRTLEEMLQSAIEGETYEWTQMYALREQGHGAPSGPGDGLLGQVGETRADPEGDRGILYAAAL